MTEDGHEETTERATIIPVQDQRIRKLNILRMLMAAWTRNTRASLRKLVDETVVFCVQVGYEPVINKNEINQLIDELNLKPLLVPDWKPPREKASRLCLAAVDAGVG